MAFFGCLGSELDVFLHVVVAEVMFWNCAALFVITKCNNHAVLS